MRWLWWSGPKPVRLPQFESCVLTAPKSHQCKSRQELQRSAHGGHVNTRVQNAEEDHEHDQSEHKVNRSQPLALRRAAAAHGNWPFFARVVIGWTRPRDRRGRLRGAIALLLWVELRPHFACVPHGHTRHDETHSRAVKRALRHTPNACDHDTGKEAERGRPVGLTPCTTSTSDRQLECKVDLEAASTRTRSRCLGIGSLDLSHPRLPRRLIWVASRGRGLRRGHNGCGEPRSA